MKTFVSYTFMWAMAFLGMCVGLALCAGVGYFLFLPFHATTAGVLCGFAWYGFGFYHSVDHIYERTNERARIFATTL